MKKTLIVIAGPTAVGKTKLSIELAQKLNCAIISCDSRQFYVGLNIGTAKPTKEEQAQAPHYFIDSKKIQEEYTAGMFENEALEKIQTLFQKDNQVIMVGGSTLYIDAITKGFDDLPKDLEVRKKLIHETDKKGLDSLLFELQTKDPEYFAEVDRSNAVRVQRALEVIRISGKKYSELRKGSQKSREFELLKIVLNDERAALYSRINHRVDQMVLDGLEEEARSFYPFKGLSALKTVGYQEFFDYFDAKISKEEAIELIKRNSRRYAKRQLTWFRRDPDYHWFGPDQFLEIFELIQSQI
ncbi:MAG: tRNA (adenosine(37)-N6)-dimethylallyltransferase MiaA [Crocinitomicaceae bacterium]